MESIPIKERFDVLVIGAGAAGSVIAAKTAQAGKSVLILEAGPERRLGDLESSQISARRLKWGGAHVEEQGNHKVGHAFNSGYGTGGGALHHYGVWLRLHENDFNVKSKHGISLDWPIEYKDLQPYYDRIQEEVGISGDAEKETWRPPGNRYPMSALPVFSQGLTIEKGFNAINQSLAPTPLAINSRGYNNRPSCSYDGWCDAGCPTGALANPLVTYLPQAFAAGAQIRHRATVSRILHDASGSKATGAEFFDEQGVAHTVDAKCVVVSAFAVQTARILLNSVSDKHPRGLANNRDQVGRYLTTHPSHVVCGLFEQETQPYLGVPAGQLVCQEQYENKQKGGAFGSYQWLAANAVKPNDLLGLVTVRPDIYGADLQDYLKKATKHFAQMNFVGEDLSLADNRVTLSSNKDKFGIPLAVAIHNITSRTEQLADLALKEGYEVFNAAGAYETWNGPRVGMHIMGGTVMGDKPAHSVCDSFGLCHGLENLYLAGSGVFPTSGAVNPTFTIHALALRTAEQISRR